MDAAVTGPSSREVVGAKGGGQLCLYVQVIGAFSGLNSLPALPDLTYWHIGLNLETLKSPGHFKPDFLLIVLCGCEEDQRQKYERLGCV